ncbi:MAG: hypothetical protein U1E60_00490 [Reyranellaceae bacterium]
MSTTPTNPAQFIAALLRAVREVTGHRQPPAWTHVSKVQSKLATANTDAVEAGIRLAVKKGWLRADGDPAASVTLTVDGVKFLQT